MRGTGRIGLWFFLDRSCLQFASDQALMRRCGSDSIYVDVLLSLCSWKTKQLSTPRFTRCIIAVLYVETVQPSAYSLSCLHALRQQLVFCDSNL